MIDCRLKQSLYYGFTALRLIRIKPNKLLRYCVSTVCTFVYEKREDESLSKTNTQTSGNTQTDQRQVHPNLAVPQFIIGLAYFL